MSAWSTTRGFSSLVQHSEIDGERRPRDLKVRGWSEGSIDQFLGDDVAEDAKLEVLVGRDGRIRRVTVRWNAGGEQTEMLELSAFGRHIAAKPPAPETAADLAG